MSEIEFSNKKNNEDKALSELRENITKNISLFSTNPSENIDKLILDYVTLEKNFLNKTKLEDVCNLMLLYIIQENYIDAKCCKDRAFLYKLVNEKNAALMNQVDFILTKLKTNPYSNIYEYLFKLFVYGKETQEIAEVFLNIYEQKQAFFISSIYKNISEESLVDLLKPHFVKDNISKYAAKYNISLKQHNNKNYYSFESFNISYIEKNTTGEFQTQPNYIKDSKYVVNNLTFINNKANELENIAKANFLLLNK